MVVKISTARSRAACIRLRPAGAEDAVRQTVRGHRPLLAQKFMRPIRLAGRRLGRRGAFSASIRWRAATGRSSSTGRTEAGRRIETLAICDAPPPVIDAALGPRARSVRVSMASTSRKRRRDRRHRVQRQPEPRTRDRGPDRQGRGLDPDSHLFINSIDAEGDDVAAASPVEGAASGADWQQHAFGKRYVWCRLSVEERGGLEVIDP